MLKADTKQLEKEAQIILNHYKAGNFNTVESKAKKLLKKQGTVFQSVVRI